MAIGITLAIRDEAGDERNTSFNVPSATTLVQAAAAGQAMAQLVDAAADGKVVGITLNYPIPLPSTGIKATPLDGSRSVMGARFTFETVDGYVTRMNIPARAEAIIADGGKNVITTGGTAGGNIVAAFTGGLDVSGTGGTGSIDLVDTHDSEISALMKAVESSRSS